MIPLGRSRGAEGPLQTSPFMSHPEFCNRIASFYMVWGAAVVAWRCRVGWEQRGLRCLMRCMRCSCISIDRAYNKRMNRTTGADNEVVICFRLDLEMFDFN